MTVGSQEHDDLIAQFERDCRISGGYRTKEAKSLWKQGHVYCHGPTNEAFIAYRMGYAFGRCVYMQATA